MKTNEDIMRDVRAHMALGATAAQYAAGQVVQGLVRTDDDVNVLRSYIDNARRQIADAQEQLLSASVELRNFQKAQPPSCDAPRAGPILKGASPVQVYQMNHPDE